MSRDKKELTEKEMKFVENKAMGINSAESVRKAGYQVANSQSAGSLGHQLLKKPLIAQRIQELRKAQAKKLMEHLPQLLQEMLEMALGTEKAQKVTGYNARVKFEASRDLLDRIPGMGKKEKIQVSDEEFPAEVLRLLNRLNRDEGEA